MTNKINLKVKGNNIFIFFQKLGPVLMYPISLLPLAGLFYGLSTILGHNLLSSIMKSMGLTIFISLPILIYFSYISKMGEQSKNKYIPAFLFLLIYFIIQTKISNINEFLSIFLTNLSIFDGIIIGIIFNQTWKKINNIILIIFTSIIWSILIIPIIILIKLILYLIAYIFSLLPFGLNAFLYGFSNRILNPFGLHSILIPAFNYSQLGGTLILTPLNSTENFQSIIKINGDSAIWQYMFSNNIPFDNNSSIITINNIEYKYSINFNDCVGQYQQGFFPIMIFAYPIAGYAITRKIGWEKGKIFLISSFTPMLTGITESFDFLYLFTNPLLYLFNAIYVGLSFMLMNIAHVHIWLSVGWIIDVILFGIIPQIQGFLTNWQWILIIGPIMMIPYYLSFRYLFSYKE